jgi:hypothetical protein
VGTRVGTAVRVSYQPLGSRPPGFTGGIAIAFLQRVLKIQALVNALAGLVLIFIPGPVLTGLNQPGVDEGAWLRAYGIALVTLAMLMWLVGQRVTENWWWSWAFAVFEVGTAVLLWLNAMIGLVPGASAWPWWTFGGVAAVFGALDLWGMARAGQERPAA